MSTEFQRLMYLFQTFKKDFEKDKAWKHPLLWVCFRLSKWFDSPLLAYFRTRIYLDRALTIIGLIFYLPYWFRPGSNDFRKRFLDAFDASAPALKKSFPANSAAGDS